MYLLYSMFFFVLYFLFIFFFFCFFYFFFFLLFYFLFFFFFFQAEDGIRDGTVTGVQTCALPIFQVDAIDVSPEMIAWAQQTATPGVTYAVADVAALPWPDATFDVVVSSLSQDRKSVV